MGGSLGLPEGLARRAEIWVYLQPPAALPRGSCQTGGNLGLVRGESVLSVIFGWHAIHVANHCQEISPGNPCQQRTSEFLPAAKPREFLPAEHQQTLASSAALQDLHQRLSPMVYAPANPCQPAAEMSSAQRDHSQPSISLSIHPDVCFGAARSSRG